MMSVVVRASSRVMFPLLLVYSAYIIAGGHLTPGGGFQGGAIAGGAFILVSIAMGWGKAGRMYSEVMLSLLENIGSIAYVSIGLVGIILGGAFLFNWLPHGTPGELLSAGFMLPINMAIGLKVAAGVFTIAVLMLALSWEEDGLD